MDPAACLSSAVGTQPNTIARVSGDKVCAAHAGPGRKRLLLDQRKCHVSRFAFCCRGFCGNAAWARLLRQWPRAKVVKSEGLSTQGGAVII